MCSSSLGLASMQFGDSVYGVDSDDYQIVNPSKSKAGAAGDASRILSYVIDSITWTALCSVDGRCNTTLL